MTPRPRVVGAALACAAAACLLLTGSALAAERAVDAVLDDLLRPLAPFARSGVLVDRVLPIARLGELDGGADAPAVDRARWRQAHDELRRAALGPPAGPSPAAIEAAARSAQRSGLLPIALLDVGYDRVRPSALGDGALRLHDGRIEVADGTAIVSSRAVAGAVLAGPTYRGGNLSFVLDRRCFVTDLGDPSAITLDFGDGRGPRAVAFGQPLHVNYDTPGVRVIEARIARADGTAGVARLAFEVRGLAAPLPDDTLQVTAGIAHQGVVGSGRAFIALAPGHTELTNPVVVIEGFDLDDSMNWDELYALLNQQNLIETLRADGFDAVVLDFDAATAPIQQNAYVVAELIQQVQARIAPTASLALVGASMGALCSRYALAYMETHAIPHRVRTWISFDGPQAGADIPLGLQYWIQYFASQSTDAAAFLAVLDSPAARQMLLYRLTEPPSAAPQPDPMRTALLAEFASLGGYPSLPRRVAVANGSGSAVGQGFAPGAQLIRYEYSSLFLALTGNVWAVPDQTSRTIFAGSQRVLFSTTSRTVTVSGTLPWDGAPGGSRASMAQLDATSPPYGDIVALHPSHCFIPTVSALALATTDPFFNASAEPDLLARTPFDAVFFPAVNEEHVALSAASAAWLRSEIGAGVLDAPPPGASAPRLALAVRPSPLTGEARFTLTLPEAAPAALSVHAIDGRCVRDLGARDLPAGSHSLTWDGRDGQGRLAPPGVYLVLGRAGTEHVSRRIVKLD